MPSTWYVDYEGGSDAADGTSFANRWKTIDAATAGAGVAAGDTVRIMGSPAPTSLGVNGTWTDGPLPAAHTLGASSSTNATPIVITDTAHGWANGDTIVVTGHTTNVNANGTWEIANKTDNTYELVGSMGVSGAGSSGTARKINNCRIVLASALTTNIASTTNRGEGRVAWTASANVTATLNTTDFKCADCSDSVAIAAGFTTGLAAHFPTGTLDLSAKQGVSFWVKQTAGTVAVASDIELTLGTVSDGTGVVHHVAIPAIAALNRWVPIYVDLTANMNAAIESIGLTVLVDRGAQTFLISNVIAVKAAGDDNLNLTSLIGKNTAGETWWGLQSINGTRVMVDSETGTLPTTTTYRGYSGVSETATAYKRETIKTALQASAGNVIQAVQVSGSAGSLFALEGGYDRSGMTTQNLETWCDGQSGFGYGLDINARSFISTNLLNYVRCLRGTKDAAGASTDVSILSAHANNCSGIGVEVSAAGSLRWNFGTIFAVANLSSGLSTTSSGGGHSITTVKTCSNQGTGLVPTGTVYLGTVVSNNNVGSGMTAPAVGCVCGSITASGNTTSGVAPATRMLIGSLIANVNGTAGIGTTSAESSRILGGSTTGNTSGGITLTSGTLSLRNFTVNEATKVSGWTAYSDSRVNVQAPDGTVHDYCDGGDITYDLTKWTLSPTSANRSANYPLTMNLAQIACNANKEITFTAVVQRSNTGLAFRLVCKGGQLAGIVSDVVDSMAEAADTDETLTLTMTPTEMGVLNITVEAYGGTTYEGRVYSTTYVQAA